MKRFIAAVIILSLTGYSVALAFNSTDTDPTKPVRLFTIDRPQELARNALRSNARVRVFSYDQASYQELKTLRPAILTMSIPNLDGTDIEVELIENQVLSPGFVLSTSEADQVAYTPGLYYKGKVKGQDSSIVFISLFDNEVMANISAPGKGNLVIGSSKALRRNTFLLYDDHEVEPLKFNCLTEELPSWNHELKEIQKGGFRQNSAAGCINVHFEIGSSVFSARGGSTGAADFISGLYNGVSAIYSAEGISTSISGMKVWTPTSPEPYGTGLGFGNSLGTNYVGNLAHYVRVVDGNSASGVAWLDVLCGGPTYAYSELFATNAAYPSYSWNVNVITHEMGHNLGSPHTHSCTWPGGAIDDCAQPEGGCPYGPKPPVNGGTIMSYCHQSGNPGISFSKGFGPLPGNLIRSKVSAASCLSGCGGGVILPPTPTLSDLTISSVSLSTSSISSTNQAITLTCTTSNLGERAGSSVSRIYFSNDNNFSSNDINMADITVPELATSASLSAFVNISLPSTTTPGTYYFIVCADALSTVTESNENNNCRSAALTLNAPAATPQLFPDLELGVISGIPASITPGAQFSLSGSVANKGSAAAPASSLNIVFSTDSYYSADDASLYSGTVPALNPAASTGFSSAVTMPATLALKNYYIIVCVDAANSIAETNEGNNCASYALSANVPTPDLSISTIVLNQNPVPTGSPFTVSFSSFNGGTAAGSSFNVGVYLATTNTTPGTNDKLLGESTITGLGPNQVANGNVSVNSIITPGKYNLLVCADNRNQVSESNENNNCAFVSLIVTNPLPDLVVDKFEVPVDFVALQPQAIKIKIKNNGSKKSSASTTAYMYFTDDGVVNYRAKLITQFTIPVLEVGASVDTSILYTFGDDKEEGSIYFGLCVDNENKVIEENEDNNCASGLTRIIVPLPDIASFSAARYADPVGRGTSINYPLLVSNIGRLASPEVHTEYYVSYKPLLKSSGGFRLLVDTTRAMPVGDTLRKNVSLKLPFALTAGSWYLNVCVDYDYKIKEVSEINNCQSIRLIIRNQMPDVTVTHFGMQDAVAFAGIPSPVKLSIKNIGEISAQGLMAKIFYHGLSGDTISVTDLLIDSIEAGKQLDQEIPVLIPNSLAGQNLFFEVVLDPANTIKEALENNNSAGFMIQPTIPLPDLVTDILSMSDTVLHSGNTYTFGHSITNQGNLASDSFSIKYYLVSASQKIIPLDTKRHSGLVPLQKDTVLYSFVLDQAISTDTYQLIAFCDADDQINESNESNNQNLVNLKIAQSLPDVMIAGLVARDSVSKGDTVRVDFLISNLGDWVMPPVQDPVLLSLDSIPSAPDLVVGQLICAALNPSKDLQQSVNIVIPKTITTGLHYVHLQINHENKITESDNTNNQAFIPIYILPNIADLENIGMRLEKAGVEPGTDLLVDLMISNIGETPVQEYTVQFELKNNPKDSTSVITFPLITHTGMMLPGETNDMRAVLSMPDSLSAHTYYLMSCIDPINEIAELNKMNNCGQILLKVENKHALTTGIKQPASLFTSVGLYPNPATEWLAIEGTLKSGHQKVLLEVKDYLGRIITKQSFQITDQINYRLDVGQLSHGLYFVEITSTQGTWKQKFVKQ